MTLAHRSAVLTDLPEIVRIYNSTIASREVTADLEPVTEASRLAWLQEHTSTVTRPLWVAEDGGRIAGWLSFSDFHARAAYRHTAEISVYVDEKMHGKGVGRYLLQQAIAAAPDLEIHTLIGLIFVHNVRSLKLFERTGFVRWAEMPRIAELDDIERDLVIVGRRVA